MKIRKYTVSRDDSLYEAWPTLARMNNGRLVCAFAECVDHMDRSFSRIVAAVSDDNGKSWSRKFPVTEQTTPDMPYYYNNPALRTLSDGRLVLAVDRVYGTIRNENGAESRIILYFSGNGEDWTDGVETAGRGIVPDRILELPGGRWLLSCHHLHPGTKRLAVRSWFSDDSGATWSEPVYSAFSPELNLCEMSMIRLDDFLIGFTRENSGLGLPCYKVISGDGGRTWSSPIRLPLPGCHRPSAGVLRDGRIMITYRMMHGFNNSFGSFQNLFAGVFSRGTALTEDYEKELVRIFPVDHDESPFADTGYSCWTILDRGGVYLVNYLKGDAEKAYIRGYFLRESEIAPVCF